MLYTAIFKCEVCEKEYLFMGKGRKQFLKRLYSKGCRVIRGKAYCYQCRKGIFLK